MQEVKFKVIDPAHDRRHYITEDDVRTVLGRLPAESFARLRAVYFADRSRGVRILGSVTWGRREITIYALPPRVSLSRFLVRGQTCAGFGAPRGAQWPHLAVRRFLLYDVFLHELGHLQLVDARAGNIDRRFALERRAQLFADKWRRMLWSERFDHVDPVHNAPGFLED